jgi:hypothetical protein
MKTYIVNLVAALIIMIGGVHLTVPQNAQAESANFISTSATCGEACGETCTSTTTNFWIFERTTCECTGVCPDEDQE